MVVAGHRPRKNYKIMIATFFFIMFGKVGQLAALAPGRGVEAGPTQRRAERRAADVADSLTRDNAEPAPGVDDPSAALPRSTTDSRIYPAGSGRGVPITLPRHYMYFKI